MPAPIIPQNQWETDFEGPLPGEPGLAGAFRNLIQRILNRTERLKNRIGAILGLPWDATPPDTIAGLAGRVGTLENGQGNTTLSAHRSASVLDHPDGSVTAAKLAPVRNAPTITPSPGDWLLGGLASGTGVGKLPLGQTNGVPLLNASGALASADAYLSRGSVTNAVDWNTLTDAGTYEIGSSAFGAGSANMPPATTQQGHLLVFKTSEAATQVYVPKGSDPGIYWRQYAGGTWSSWAAAGVTYGSNSNGSYIRFADGTQICWAKQSSTEWSAIFEMSVVRENVTVYYKDLTDLVFPAAFVAEPSITVGGDASGAQLKSLVVWNPSASGFNLAANYQISGNSIFSYYIAIGRWK